MLGSARSTACRRLLQVAFAAALLALAAGAGGASAKPGSANGGPIADLTWGVPQTIRSLDYTHSGDPGTASVVFLGMEPLVRYDAQGRLQPDLASSFSIPNPTTYVYNLRSGVKFWDGTPLTTADVIYSLQRSASKEGGSELATFFGSVASMKATGPSQVTIKLKGPDPFFRYSLAVTPIGEKAFWSQHLKDIGTPGVMNMGTGPFKFVSFTPDQGVTLARNDDYWGKKPSVENLSLKFITDPNTLLLAVRSGQVDGTFKVPQDQIGQYKSLSDIHVSLVPEELAAYYSLDVEDPPFDDIHVRRALAYATDKAGMVKAVLRGYGQPAPTMPPPQQWGDLMSQAKVQAFYASLPHYTYNLAKAKAQLAASAYPKGFTATRHLPGRPPGARQGAARARAGREAARDHPERQADPDQPVAEHALHPPQADGHAGRKLDGRLPRSGRRAVTDLPERERDEELVQHRELQEREDGRADRRPEQVGRPGDPGRGSSAGP